MRKDRIVVITLAGLAIVGILGFLNANRPSKLSHKDSGDWKVVTSTFLSKPASSEKNSSTMARSENLVRSLTKKEPLQKSREGEEAVLSFIQFVQLPENYDVQGNAGDWRTYRQYRRSVAKSI